MAWVSLRLGRPAGRMLLRIIAAYFLLFSPSARRAAADWLRRVRGPGAPAPGWREWLLDENPGSRRQAAWGQRYRGWLALP